MNHTSRRRGLRRASYAAAGAVALMAAGLGTLAGSGPASAATPSDYAPVITHTGTGPTGYTVTFRYYAPDATSMRIKGEWYFERPSELDPAVGDSTTTVATQGYTPDQWQPGDVPIAYPNSSSANWPVADMTKDAATGVWSYTTPLPSGVFSYAFYQDCTAAAPALTGCTALADPSNLPWNQTGDTVVGSKQLSSQVYLPADPAFGATDYSWQAPAAQQGKLTEVSYPSPGHVTPAGSNYAVVYTPPGYDPNRATPYPTLYLSHGGGGNETDWTTQGAAGDILDNLVASGQAKRFVVVMTNNNGYPSSTFNDAQDQDIITNLIPWVEQHYDVGRTAASRAFAGLSAGGILTNSFMIKYPDTFGTYDEMSAGLPPAYATLTTAQANALKGKDITLSSGIQDPIYTQGFGTMHTGGRNQAVTFATAGVPFDLTLVDGGHEWYVWRLLLRDLVVNSPLLRGEPAATATKPTVTVQPDATTTAVAGKPVSLLATATGSPQPTVQWQTSTDGTTWTDVAGATAPAYTLTATSALDGHRYRAVFTNSEGTATSTATMLDVKSASTVKAQLKQKRVAPSGHARVTVTVGPRAADPTGAVRVHYGSRALTVRLKAKNHGKATVRLGHLPKGSYRVYAVYAGDDDLTAATSRKVTLRVR